MIKCELGRVELKGTEETLKAEMTTMVSTFIDEYGKGEFDNIVKLATADEETLTKMILDKLEKEFGELFIK